MAFEGKAFGWDGKYNKLLLMVTKVRPGEGPGLWDAG